MATKKGEEENRGSRGGRRVWRAKRKAVRNLHDAIISSARRFTLDYGRDVAPGQGRGEGAEQRDLIYAHTLS